MSKTEPRKRLNKQQIKLYRLINDKRGRGRERKKKRNKQLSNIKYPITKQQINSNKLNNKQNHINKLYIYRNWMVETK